MLLLYDISCLAHIMIRIRMFSIICTIRADLRLFIDKAYTHSTVVLLFSITYDVFNYVFTFILSVLYYWSYLYIPFNIICLICIAVSYYVAIARTITVAIVIVWMWIQLNLIHNSCSWCWLAQIESIFMTILFFGNS